MNKNVDWIKQNSALILGLAIALANMWLFVGMQPIVTRLDHIEFRMTTVEAKVERLEEKIDILIVPRAELEAVIEPIKKDLEWIKARIK